MSRLSEIEGRLAASESAAGTNWKVGGLTVHGGYAAVATDALDVSTDDHLPEECAELFAHAPADLAALVKFAREVDAQHQPLKVIRLNPIHDADCDANICGTCDTPWPCLTAASIQRLGEES